MIFVFCFFAVVLVYFSYKSFRGGIDYLKFFEKEIAKPKSDFTAFTTIFVPCRGIDNALEVNLNALFVQDFPNYEIIFVVDSKTDEAVSIIETVIKNARLPTPKSRLIIAGKSKSESQKIHNLRKAVLHVADESKIFVFVDSDARPNKNWLRNLIAPLKDGKIGAATGYRWFISPKRNFASQLRAVWNASIASTLGGNVAKNFVWGGSMAMRREVFEKLEMREKWRGTLSDDFTVTRTMKAANLPVYFVPQALTVSVENCTFSELFEFTTRQMKITRVYAQDLWIQSFLGAGLFNLVFIWGIFNLFFYSLNSFALLFSLVSLLLISVFSIGKSWLRLNAVKLVLKDYESDLKKQFWTQNTLWIFTPAIYFYNDFCALVSREIVWRGIKYELKSPTETIVFEENTTQK